MSYELARQFPDIIAAIVPVAGSTLNGFIPGISYTGDSISVMDIHGTKDVTVPANSSIGMDDAIFEHTADNLEYFNTLNGCSGEGSQYYTNYDGKKEMWCTTINSRCTNNVDVVRCSWDAEHEFPNEDGWLNKNPWGMQMAWDFMAAHPKQ